MVQISEPSFLFLGTLWSEAFQRSLGGTGHLPDILIHHPPPLEGLPAYPGHWLLPTSALPLPGQWGRDSALGAESQKGLKRAPVPMHRLTGSPKPGKSPRERARAVSLLVAPILLSALPSGLAQLGRSSWDYQGSAKRFRGSQNLRSSPPGLASAPSRVGEGSRVDPCPLCYFTCDLSVAGRDTQLIWLVCDSPVGTGHLATPCEPFGLALP